MKRDIREIIKEKILILDGAMGTEIQKYNLTEADFRGERFADLPGMMKGNNDMLNITRPDVITDIYRRYLEAGADIISANTFSCQRISQADYHLEDCAREMAYEGARLARIECDKYSTDEKPRFVAGDVGPTNKTCSMSPDVSDPAAREITYDELFTDVCEQIDGLIEGGVDVILIETIFDTLNCKARSGFAHHDQSHRERLGRKNAQRTNGRCLPRLALSLSHLLRGHELCLRSSTDETLHRTSGEGCTLLY